MHWNKRTVNLEFFARILFSQKSIKRHICDVIKSRLGHDIPISVNDRVILPLQDGFNFTKLRMRCFAIIKPSRKFPNLQYVGTVLAVNLLIQVSFFITLFLDVCLASSLNQNFPSLVSDDQVVSDMVSIALPCPS